MFMKFRGRGNDNCFDWQKVERLENWCQWKGTVWERKFPGSAEDALVLDMLNIQVELQQAVKEVSPGDTDSDIFTCEIIVANMKMG